MPTQPTHVFSLLFAYFAIEFFLLPATVAAMRSGQAFLVRLSIALVQHILLLGLLWILAPHLPSFWFIASYLAWVAFAIRFPERSANLWILKHMVALLLLGGCFLSATHAWAQSSELFGKAMSPAVMKAALAYMLVTRPASTLVAYLMRPWVPSLGANNGTSLPNGGTGIGYLERALIVTFILFDHWDAIGFLLAAKGILRFNDIGHGEHRASSEYVILGTLISFSLAIAIGLAIHPPSVKSDTTKSASKTISLDNRSSAVELWMANGEVHQRAS